MNFKKIADTSFKNTGKVAHKSTNRETSVITYVSLKLNSSIWSFVQTLLQRHHQTGICCSYSHLIDIISDWVANALEVFKDSNQFIPLKLQFMKSEVNGIARHGIHNGLVGTVGDFSLPSS